MNKFIYIFTISSILLSCNNEIKNKSVIKENDSISIELNLSKNDTFEQQKGESELDSLNILNEDTLDNFRYIDSIVISELIIHNQSLGNVMLGSNINYVFGNKKLLLEETEIEFEDTFWKGKRIMSVENKELLVLLETNWKKKEIISRITIFTPTITTDDGLIRVGLMLKQITNEISIETISFRDGYMYLELKKYPNVYLEFDIKKYPELNYGISNIDDLPPELEIFSIVMMGRQ